MSTRLYLGAVGIVVSLAIISLMVPEAWICDGYVRDDALQRRVEESFQSNGRGARPVSPGDARGEPKVGRNAGEQDGCVRPVPTIPLCAPTAQPKVKKHGVSCIEYSKQEFYPKLHAAMKCYRTPFIEQTLNEQPCDPEPVALPLYFHTFWRGKPYFQMEYTIRSFLVTQDLTQAKFNFWTDAESIELPEFKAFIALFEPYKEYVNFLVMDVPVAARGTCLDGKPNFLDPKVDNLDARMYSDLIRILVLKHYGGVWIDSDMYLARDMRPLVAFFGNFASAAYKEDECARKKHTMGGCWNNAILSVRGDGPMKEQLLEKLCQLPYRSWSYRKPHPDLKLQFGGWVWNEGVLQLCAHNRPDCYLHPLPKTMVDPIWGVCLRARAPRTFKGGMSTGFCRERDDLGPVDPINVPKEMFWGGYAVHSRITQCGKEGPHTFNHNTSLFSRVFAVMDNQLKDGRVPIAPYAVNQPRLNEYDVAFSENRVDRRTGKIMNKPLKSES